MFLMFLFYFLFFLFCFYRCWLDPWALIRAGFIIDGLRLLNEQCGDDEPLETNSYWVRNFFWKRIVTEKIPIPLKLKDRNTIKLYQMLRKDKEWNTELIRLIAFAAVTYQHDQIFELLFHKELQPLLNVNKEVDNPQDRNLLIHYAARVGGFEIIKILIERCNASLCLSNLKNQIPLHLACEKAHTQVVRMMLTSWSMEQLDGVNKFPIEYAVESENGQLIEVLINKLSTMVFEGDIGESEKEQKIRDILGASILRASQIGNLTILDKVLRIHFTVPNVNYRDRKTGSTAVKWACSVGNVEILKKLIQQKADINVLDDGKISPLIIACQYGHPKIVRELLRHKHLDVNYVEPTVE